VEIQGPLRLESGAELSPVRIAYETYGRLDPDGGNAVLICHPLSGDAHAAGFHPGDARPGWWDMAIGPGKGFDTTKHFVVCSNVIGGCQGSTGPSSLNPRTGRPYGSSFPVITIKDMVNAQKLLLDHLGIKHLHAVAGGSMGGMQALQWLVSYPGFVDNGVVIGATASSSPQQIAFNTVGRRAIQSDPAWNGGDYYGTEGPKHGLSLARMVGHITYLSDGSMMSKFGRGLQDKDSVGYDFSTDFQVESYLQHQGDTFIQRFDPNSYLYVTKAIDYFDLSVNGSLITGLAGVKAAVMVIGISSDWLYPPYQSQDIVEALKANNVRATYGELRSDYGHDAFLLEDGQLNYLLRGFLERVVASDVMAKDVQVIPEGGTIDKAAELMICFSANHLPVVSPDGRLSGIVTSWDIARAVAKRIGDLNEIITRNVVTARPNEPVEDVLRKMEDADITGVPVVDDDGRVVGLVTAGSASTGRPGKARKG